MYQDIDGDDDDDAELEKSFDNDCSDDYESIEEIKQVNNVINKADGGLEWRVLSSLDGDIGEDWRIVDTLPRYSNKQQTYWQEKQILCDEFKETSEINEEPMCKQLSIMCTNNVNNVASDSGCEQPINARYFLEKLLTSPNTEDFYQNDESVATNNTTGEYLICSNLI